MRSAAAIAVAAVLPWLGPSAPALAAPGGSGSGCIFEPPNTWVCASRSGIPGSPGQPGRPARTARVTCTLTRLSESQAIFLGLQWPPPRGHHWDAITCPGTQPFGGVVLVSTRTGAPAITPRDLLQLALGQLFVPALAPQTAPPRGSDGLVGLPEWFWVPPAAWRPVSVTVTAGPVFATATATPESLTFVPGGGLGGASCPGPGTPYNAALPASAQATACSYTYPQSSAGQPGAVYRAAVTATWRVSWTGSGGAGGVVSAALQVPAPLDVPVAEGQALVSG